MRIVHVVAAGELGGAERMLVDLTRGPGSERTSVALFTPNEALRRLLEDAGLDVDDRGPVREGPLPFLRSTLGEDDVAWLADVLARRRAEIVHLHTFASQVLGTRAAERVGARVVRTEHSTRVYDDASCRPFARWSLPRAHAVVFISEHVRRVAAARFPSLGGARVIHNGVDTTRFEVAAPPPAEPGAPVRFVALGRLDPRKGLSLAIEALANVPGTELDIVGDGDERGRLERLARATTARDRIRFVGHLDDVRPAIARANAVLSSAREEGLGIALLEAMAMGRPVVAVPTGGIPEIVVEGETGWLADARTAPALERVMARAAADRTELARRGVRARERVLARFSVEAMRAAYARVYADVQ